MVGEVGLEPTYSCFQNSTVTFPVTPRYFFLGTSNRTRTDTCKILNLMSLPNWTMEALLLKLINIIIKNYMKFLGIKKGLRRKT